MPAIPCMTHQQSADRCTNMDQTKVLAPDVQRCSNIPAYHAGQSLRQSDIGSTFWDEVTPFQAMCYAWSFPGASLIRRLDSKIPPCARILLPSQAQGGGRSMWLQTQPPNLPVQRLHLVRECLTAGQLCAHGDRDSLAPRPREREERSGGESRSRSSGASKTLELAARAVLHLDFVQTCASQ